MFGTKTAFMSNQAPCGMTVDGQHYREDDDQGLVISVQHFGCGCQASQLEYHDGTFQTLVSRHDRKDVLADYGPDYGT